jgi:uncharacterized RDD family membrane protein YckC
VTTGSADKWNLDPGETLLALARVQPPGRIEAQSGGNGFELGLTNRRLLLSKRRALANRNRVSIVDSIPLGDITAVRTEKRHPPATLGIPLFRLDLVRGSPENGFSCETSSFGVRHLQGLAEKLIEQRPTLASAPWPDPTPLEPAGADGVGGKLAEEGRAALAEEKLTALTKAKRRLAVTVAVLLAVTTVGIILWRSEDHPGGSFTIATIVLLVALYILLHAWQLWDGIRRSTRQAEPVGESAPSFTDVRCAGFWRRGAGFLIDVVAIFVIAFLAEVVVLALAHPVFGADVNFDSNSQLGANVVGAAIPLLIFLYPVALIATRGRTLGMQFLGIRLYGITAGGSVAPAGGWNVVGRTVISMFFMVALFFPALIDYLWALGGPKHQCLHDKWSGTIALDVRSGPPQPSLPPASAGALEEVSGD